MTTVSFLDLVGSFKLAFHEVLATYFDGGIHDIFNNQVQFLQPTIVYDSRYLGDPPQGLTLAIIGNSSNWLNDLKFTHPGPGAGSQEHGFELRAEVFRSVIVTARLQDDSSGQNRKLVDQCWSQLQLLIGFDRKSFADRGILYPRISSPVPADITPNQNFVQATGRLECQVMAPFARYNTL